MSLSFELPDELAEEIAQRAAEIVVEQLDHRDGERWSEYMDARTAATYLGVSVERVRKLKDRREIPFHQEGVGCRVFFKRGDLDAWMDEQRVEARKGGCH